MLRKISVVAAASAATLSLLTAHPAAADNRTSSVDVPSSVSESGPNRATHHEVAPTERTGDVLGRTAGSGSIRSYGYDSRSYTVQTPSSSNESAPFLAGDQMVPTVPVR